MLIVAHHQDVGLLLSLHDEIDDARLEAIGVLEFIDQDKLVLLPDERKELSIRLEPVPHHQDHVIIIIPGFGDQRLFIGPVDIGELALALQPLQGIGVFGLSFPFLSPFRLLLIVELGIVREIIDGFVDFCPEEFRSYALTLELTDDPDDITHIELHIMPRLQIGKIALDEYLGNHPSGIELLEHLHARGADKTLRIFFIDESLAETVERLDIDAESISADKALQTVPHGKRSGFRIGQCQYVSRRSISFREDISDAQREELRFTGTRSSNHRDGPIDGIYGEFLSGIEARIR